MQLPDDKQPGGEAKALSEALTQATPAGNVHLITDHVFTYSPERVEAFLDTVFHAGLPEGAYPLFYTARNTQYGPGLPLQEAEEGLLKVLRRTRNGRALYFGMSSAYPDAEGVLRHRRESFAALHVVVLDDIGTKVPVDSLPEELEPTYIIESSAGNFQYGYVLDEPITDLALATALVQLVGLSGLTDGGGVMATKIVRLPDGINGKPVEDKRHFAVNLVSDDGPLWTPRALARVLNVEIDNSTVTWDRILDGYTPVADKYNANYLPLRPVAQAASGIVDPVLEWLYRAGMVWGDSGAEWVDITCPQAHLHSAGGAETAGYKPLGRGENPKMRGFHCFHEHCANFDTKGFIAYVLHNSDIQALPIFDPSIDIFGRYVFDSVSNKVWNCAGGTVMAHNVDGFKTQFNENATAYRIGKEGRIAPVPISAANLWLASPYRPVVRGAVHDPSQGVMVKDVDDCLWVNTYRPANWGDGPFENFHVEPFEDFLSYLLPDEDSFHYVLDWITCKMQNPLFRGTGLVMVAEAFGVGRSTLGNMLATLIGGHNATTVSFDEFLNPNGFNHWEDKQLIIIPESREGASPSEARGAYKAYEILKQRVDTTVQNAVLNVKRQPHRTVRVTTSYLILTNHLNAVARPEDDRRLTILRNPDKPRPAWYFRRLYDWLGQVDAKGQPVWARHVYRWLRQRTVEDPKRLLHPLVTEAGRAMEQEAAPPLKRIVKAVAQVCAERGFAFALNTQLKHLVDRGLLVLEGQGEYMEVSAAYLRRSLDDYSLSFQHLKMRAGADAPQRLRVFRSAIAQELVPKYPHDLGRYVKPAQVPPDMHTKAKQDVESIQEKLPEMVTELEKVLQEQG